jgi:hypothetical protein
MSPKLGSGSIKRRLTGDAKDCISDSVELERVSDLRKTRHDGPHVGSEPQKKKKKKAKTSSNAVVVAPVLPSYGQLPKALPDSISLLVIELLDGDVHQGTVVTQEQRDWEALLEKMCAESKKTCAELLREPQEGQIARLCRTVCIRRYKSVRAPIVAFLECLGYFDPNTHEPTFQLTSPEWKLAKQVTLNIISITHRVISITHRVISITHRVTIV